MSWFKKLFFKKDYRSDDFFWNVLRKSKNAIILSDDDDPVTVADYVHDIQRNEGNDWCYRTGYKCDQPDHVICTQCDLVCKCRHCCWRWGCKWDVDKEWGSFHKKLKLKESK